MSAAPAAALIDDEPVADGLVGRLPPRPVELAERLAPAEVLVAIGLGCSLGDRRGRLEGVVRALGGAVGVRVLRVSRWYRTPPMRGGTARGWFLNGVALVSTTWTPHVLLDRCRALEAQAGRRRARYWGDRPLDLDILLVDGVVSDRPELVLPHPGIAVRPFVWRPLLEVWPEAVDPRTGRAWRELAQVSTPRPAPIGIAARGRVP